MSGISWVDVEIINNNKEHWVGGLVVQDCFVEMWVVNILGLDELTRGQIY